MTQRTIGAALVTMLLSSCAAPPKHEPAPASAAPPPVVVPTASAAPSSAPPVSREILVPAMAEVREPASVACRITSKQWESTLLRLSPQGQPFASVAEAPATLVFGSGAAPDSAIAVLDDGGALIRLVLRAKQAPIFTRVPTRIRGILIPDARKQLNWSGGADGKLRVGVDASFVLESPSLIEEDMECAALTISEPKYDARGSVTRRKSLPKRTVAGAAAELSVKPGVAPTVRVQGGVEVGVLARRGKSSQVLIAGDQYWLVGWIATSDLSTQPSMRGLFGRGAGMKRGAWAGRQSALVCATEIALYGQLGSERARIGTLRKGTPFIVAKGDGDADAGSSRPRSSAQRPESQAERIAITLPMSKWLWLRKGAKLSVLAAETRECTSRIVSY